MNKQQLLDEIAKLPDDIEFLAAKDDEGNGYRWISGVSVDYLPKDEHENWEIDGLLSEEDVREDFSDEEIELNLKKVAVIW